ncbi:hypothetical protein GRI39_01525 [Altererythrobacter indicus]|uniref:Immunity MXAN-0049 protein domain-containing protein n=1 Tax=Altericroceibacterium indicum TaxID=374177 RepID=A0A845A7E0_9SPHN|nr:DUF1629 domain-containing protein [Altericroceibacterium indicum]MXP24725.1 hypothetical protein [Altericroceibacterium indicum]
MKRTVDDLLALVPEGGSHIFKAKVPDVVENRFFAVASNRDYPGVFYWKNTLEFTKNPWMGARGKKRIGLDVLPTPEVSFSLKKGRLVDFYTTGTAACGISNRLRDLIEDLDPGSLEVLPIVVKAKDGDVEYNLVMPNRCLSAIDPDLCDIQIVDEDLGGGQWMRKVKYPNRNGAVIDPDLDPDIHSFADIDLGGYTWLWSRQLIDEAKLAGIKGLYTTVPESYPSIEIDRL